MGPIAAACARNPWTIAATSAVPRTTISAATAVIRAMSAAESTSTATESPIAATDVAAPRPERESQDAVTRFCSGGPSVWATASPSLTGRMTSRAGSGTNSSAESRSRIWRIGVA